MYIRTLRAILIDHIQCYQCGCYSNEMDEDEDKVDGVNQHTSRRPSHQAQNKKAIYYEQSYKY